VRECEGISEGISEGIKMFDEISQQEKIDDAKKNLGIYPLDDSIFTGNYHAMV